MSDFLGVRRLGLIVLALMCGCGPVESEIVKEPDGRERLYVVKGDTRPFTILKREVDDQGHVFMLGIVSNYEGFHDKGVKFKPLYVIHSSDACPKCSNH